MKALICMVLLLVPASILGQRSKSQEGSHTTSPCSQVVSYEDDKKLSNRWYGTVEFNALGDRPFNLTITLDHKANLLGAWIGPIISEDNRNFILLHPAPANVEGSNRISVRFFVNFRRGFPVPYVMTIRIDGYTLCSSVGIDSGFDSYSPEPIKSTYPPTRPQNLVSRPTVASITSVITRRTERPTVIPWVVTTTSTTTTRRKTESIYTHSPFARPTNTVSTSEGCGTINVRSPSHVPLLVNPQSSTYQGEWPWHVAIYSTASGNQRYICGGTLISRRVIITAAHCATNENTRREWSPEELVVYLGKHSLPRGWSVSNGVQMFMPNRIIRHPTYNSTNTSGDIAMILLHRDAEITSYVRLICLWPQQEKDIRTLKGQLGTVVGWGIDSTYQRSLQLTRVDLPVRSYEECVRSNRDFFSRYLVDKTYCAGWGNGTSPCNGDSGGGMVFQINNRWFLRGLVSTAVKLSDKIRVCNPEHYTVFVDVAQYRDWIEDNQPENVN